MSKTHQTSTCTHRVECFACMLFELNIFIHDLDIWDVGKITSVSFCRNKISELKADMNGEGSYKQNISVSSQGQIWIFMGVFVLQ